MELFDEATGGLAGETRRLVRTAWLLGLGGLVPFLALAALLLLPGPGLLPRDGTVLALSVYAAAILSFLGGIRWGAALLPAAGGWRPLALSVVPSLLAAALVLVPAPWRFAGFALAFVAQGLADNRAAKRGRLPAWFGPLRIVLTAGAALAMTAGFLATLPAGR